jgi:hypothetical protein
MFTSQAMPHDVPSQVAVPFAGAGHAVHDDGPQLDTAMLLTQAPPQSWNPVMHVKPQEMPSQVATALGGGGGQAMHDGPQASGSVSSAQWSLQR